MNYAKAQKDVLTNLLRNSKSVINCLAPDDRVIFIVDGTHAFVFPEDINWIDAERIEASCSHTNMHLPVMSAENRLEPTENLIDDYGVLARQFVKVGITAGVKSIYIQEQFLKNFESPIFYQDIDKPKGVIAVTEITQLEGEVLVGFVVPYQKKD